MNELVAIRNDEAICTSLDVAEKFEKRHDRVLRAIENIIPNLPKNGVVKFEKSLYIDAKGEKRPMYLMNRDGFSLVGMGFNGKKAIEWKLKYIEAFNKMESILSEKQTTLWIEQRKQGKLTRKAETDVIKDLIEYAKNQGSEHSQMLYMTYSKLANAMANIKDRDLATVHQLSELSFIENIILNQIQQGMKKELHYKDIYKDCKKQIELFKDIAYLN